MGFFADGENSQTPIVVGSIPHIEFPTILQTEQTLEDIGDENKPNGVLNKSHLCLNQRMLMLKILIMVILTI